MQIEPATCPACGAAYDALRGKAVTVIDGRVRAFCSSACRERGIAPPAATRPSADAQAASADAPPVSTRVVRTELKVLLGAAVITMIAFVALLASGRHAKPAAPPTAPQQPSAIAKKSDGAPGAEATESDQWLQPLAGVTRHVAAHDRRLFYGREGIPESECTGGRCGIDIEGASGAIVMAAHDGVIEAVEREPDAAAPEGRFIRIIHKGGEYTTSYMQLDGIREDLRPGIPVKLGEPIGTVARGARSHLRFAITVRNDEGARLFIDPQPLLALWPIRRHAPVSLRAMERAPREPTGPARTDSTE